MNINVNTALSIITSVIWMLIVSKEIIYNKVITILDLSH